MYNTKYLVKTQVKPPVETVWYEWRTELKIMGFTFRKEGIYTAIGSTYKGIELEKNWMLINGKLHMKPCCVLHYVGEHSKAYYFDTIEQAHNFAAGFTVNKEWIR